MGYGRSWASGGVTIRGYFVTLEWGEGNEKGRGAQMGRTWRLGHLLDMCPEQKLNMLSKVLSPGIGNCSAFALM